MIYPTKRAGCFLSNFALSILASKNTSLAAAALHRATVAAVALDSNDQESLLKEGSSPPPLMVFLMACAYSTNQAAVLCPLLQRLVREVTQAGSPSAASLLLQACGCERVGDLDTAAQTQVVHRVMHSRGLPMPYDSTYGYHASLMGSHRLGSGYPESKETAGMAIIHERACQASAHEEEVFNAATEALGLSNLADDRPSEVTNNPSKTVTNQSGGWGARISAQWDAAARPSQAAPPRGRFPGGAIHGPGFHPAAAYSSVAQHYYPPHQAHLGTAIPAHFVAAVPPAGTAAGMGNELWRQYL